jgi:MFS family permease
LDRLIQDDAMHEPRCDLPLEAQEVESHRHVRRLMLFFAVVYAGEGIGQTGRLIAQPLNYFLKEVHGWSPVQISAYLTALNVPWLIKPVYGLVSDFLPVFGYRRKIYLLGVNAAALPALCWATQIVAPSELFIVLLLTAYAMAISSTLCGAILVENGQKFSASGKFINQEWLWFNVSSIAALLMGGQLVQRLPPTSALHIATGLVALAPSAVIVVTLLLITETKNTINLGELKKSFQGLIAALKTPTLWIVGLFLFFYYFSPGFATPLYYHLTDELRFSQGYIGILGSVASGGWIIGALTYQFFFSRLGLRHLLNLSIFLGTMSSTSYLLLSGEVSAAVLYFCSGFAAMVSLVATLTLAAERCPSRSEGFAFAILLSIINFATTVADLVGSFIYDHVFTRNLAPLILVSATCTAFAFVLVPLLHLGETRGASTCWPSQQAN